MNVVNVEDRRNAVRARPGCAAAARVCYGVRVHVIDCARNTTDPPLPSDTTLPLHPPLTDVGRPPLASRAIPIGTTTTRALAPALAGRIDGQNNLFRPYGLNGQRGGGGTERDGGDERDLDGSAGDAAECGGRNEGEPYNQSRPRSYRRVPLMPPAQTPWRRHDDP